MPFKINVSHKGKTIKFEEVENEELIDKSIGDKISGNLISSDLEGYELEITGTSDKAGFPGFKEYPGAGLRKVLLTKGKGMHDKRKGVRLRKTIRGNLISNATVQINTKVIKQGKKNFDDLGRKPDEAEKSAEEEKPEEKQEEPKQTENKS